MTTEGKKPNTVNVDLPEGMSEEEFQKLFGSFNKMREYTAKRDKCVRVALNGLKDKYPDAYRALLNPELKKAGLPVK